MENDVNYLNDNPVEEEFPLSQMNPVQGPLLDGHAAKINYVDVQEEDRAVLHIFGRENKDITIGVCTTYLFLDVEEINKEGSEFFLIIDENEGMSIEDAEIYKKLYTEIDDAFFSVYKKTKSTVASMVYRIEIEPDGCSYNLYMTNGKDKTSKKNVPTSFVSEHNIEIGCFYLKEHDGNEFFLSHSDFKEEYRLL